MSGKRENERIKNKVVGMLTNIVDEVDPKNVLDFLIERRIVNIELKEKMMNKETRRDRCRALLDHLLMCSHDEAFIGFRKALEEHYHWIVERIDNENQDDFNAREEQLEKELNAAKMKLKEANRRTERLDELQNELHSTKTELKDARRELEISKQQIETLKQELEQQVKLKLLASGTQNNIPNEVILENEKIKDQVVSIYKDFVSEVDPTNVFELLIQNGIVGTKERQEMMDNATAKERCRALIDHLFSCSNKNAFIVLKEALNQHYPEIVERLAAFDSDDEEDYSASKLKISPIHDMI